MSHSGGKFLWLVAALHFHPHRVSLPLIWRTFSHLFRIFLSKCCTQRDGRVRYDDEPSAACHPPKLFIPPNIAVVNQPPRLAFPAESTDGRPKNALTLAGECKSDPIRTCKFVEKVSSAVTSGRLLATATSRSILNEFHSNTHRSIDLETLFKKSFETVTIRSQVEPENGVKWT